MESLFCKMFKINQPFSYIIFIAISTVILYSCRNSTSQDHFVNDKSFLRTEMLEITESMSIETVDARGLLISDSYIITYNNLRNDNMIQIYNRQSGDYKGAFLTKGRSRDEVVFLTKIMQKDDSNGKLKLLIQSSPKYMNWLDVDSSLMFNKAIFTIRNEFKTERQEEILVNSGASYDLGNNIFLMRYNLFNDEYPVGSMLLYDVKNDCEIGQFPRIEIDKTVSEANLLVSGNDAISPDRKVFAQALFNLNMVTFYNFKTKERRNLLFSKDALDYEKAKQQTMKENFVPYYRTCIGGTKYFYALKNPVSRDINDHFSIQLFSWDGEPKYNFSIKENLLFIDVDEKSEQLYAIISTPDKGLKVVIYSFPSYIFEG